VKAKNYQNGPADADRPGDDQGQLSSEVISYKGHGEKAEDCSYMCGGGGQEGNNIALALKIVDGGNVFEQPFSGRLVLLPHVFGEGADEADAAVVF
jgi:hypothetical protein